MTPKQKQAAKQKAAKRVETTREETLRKLAECKEREKNARKPIRVDDRTIILANVDDYPTKAIERFKMNAKRSEEKWGKDL